MEADPPRDASGCCCCRRDLFRAAGAVVGGVALSGAARAGSEDGGQAPTTKPAKPVVRGAFIYPPSKRLHGRWWSWPGNDFDAEGRQKQYMAAFGKMEQKLGMRIVMDAAPLHSKQAVTRFINEVNRSKPDGLLLIPFHNRVFGLVNQVLAGTKGAIPAVIFSCLGVKHGSVKGYQRTGVYFIQSLDNLDAIEYGMRMIRTRRTLRDSRILSVAGSARPGEAAVPFWGTRVRVISLKRYVEEVRRTDVTGAVKALARDFVTGAKKKLEPTDAAVLTAAKVHFAIRRILAAEGGDAITMDCLRRGELMPCMSFMTLRDRGIAAGCENDLYGTLTLMLLQHLFDRPGFQHNPCFETEANHYFASHCTSASKLFGTGRPHEPYLLRNYAHTNDPTCVPQVLWREGEAVTMARLVPGKTPGMLVYTGNVVKSYLMPPVGGCRTNVALTINELADVCDVRGHHNVLIYGDYGRHLHRFCRLYGLAVQT